MYETHEQRLILPAVILGCIGCLQPGFDPVFLTLLTAAHGIDPTYHGWVVTATQAGMAAGSLATWRWGSRFPRGVFAMAAAIAALAALLTAQTSHLASLLSLRATYGAAMGVIYTQAMSTASAGRPHGAYGAVFLSQLVLATGIALALPAIAEALDPQSALATLVLAPFGAFVIVAFSPRALSHEGQQGPRPLSAAAKSDPLNAWLTAGSSLLFICATMMVWTFSGALAVRAGISESVIGQAVALGSLAGAGTAMLVMRERPIVPPALTGLLSGTTLLAPIAATQLGGAAAFIAAIVALNIGSTAIIVRTSGLASAASRDAWFRRFVACTHALGMILGPLVGSLASGLFGDSGLLAAALCAIAAACLMLVIAQSARPVPRTWHPREESLDEFLTRVQH